MATAAYNAWVRAGRPWTVMRPVKALGDRLRAYGYTVYYLGSDDASHLQAAKPQDHCPFSTTGWPGGHPYPYVAALDIMPPRSGSGLPSLQQLGAQIVADRNAGVVGIGWVKYQNWEPDRDNGGRCWQDSWKPGHSRTNSTDRGHIHMSARSDVATSTVGDAYDPVARIRGTITPPQGDTEMLPFLVKLTGTPTVYLCDKFLTHRTVTAGELPFLPNALKSNGGNGAIYEWPESARGSLGVNLDTVDDVQPVTLTAEQLNALGVQIRVGVPSLDQIRTVVDVELDEQSRGGADNDPT